MPTTKSMNGFTLEFEGETITAISLNTGRKVCLKDVVVSNGRIFASKGTKGQVTKIHEPYKDSHTNDVIEVLWDGQKVSLSMKFKDLEF